MRFKTLVAVALSMPAAMATAAEPSVQQQLEQLKSEIQYIRENYERSEPVDVIKPVTEFVSPSGEIFTTLPAGGVSPSDGSKLEERVTYRKMKFNRRESVSDKIDSAVNAAIDGHVTVGLELLGVYLNTVGAGDVVDATGQTRSANRGWGSAGVDLNFSGKPMRNTLIFVDLDAASGTPAISEAWLSVQGPKKVLSLQAGVIDVTGSFDSNKAANDESAQFMTPDFVNSPLLMNPANGPGAILRADFSRYNLMLGAQNSLGASADLFDDLYWIAEAGLRYSFFGDAHLRVWGRQQPRGSQQLDQALGLSYDHRLSPGLTAFGRYGKSSYVEAYTPEDLANSVPEARVALNPLDWSASGGFELAYFSTRRLRDTTGLAYGRTEQQGGASEQYAELYYKTVLTPNFSLSLHGQGTFSRTVADAGAAALDPATGNPALNDALPNAWSTGLRVLASY